MRKTITYRGKEVSYRVLGKGRAIVLLHGFAESAEIWDEYAEDLKQEFRVITPDLPGHGETAVFSDTHTMEFMADTVKAVIDHLLISRCILVGHSMGGYVCLAFDRKYPGLADGLVLFHSHAGPDSEAAKANRQRTIRVVENNRGGFIQQFIPGLFAPENVPLYAKEIEALKKLALIPPPEGITAALRGMMERDDHTALLGKTDKPVLFIAGKADSKIPHELVLQQASLPRHAEVLTLGHVGHMGMIEARDTTIQTIRCFAKKAYGENG